MNISIIICSYNRSQSLRGTLSSLEGLIVPKGIDWEVLVVDNNSNDKTNEVVEGFAQKGILDIKYLFEARQGKSFALNTGLESANGEIIAFTDDDVLVDKDWLRAVIKATNRYEDYDGFGGRVISLWNSSLPKWIGVANNNNALRGTGFLRDEGGDDMEYHETNSGMPCGANMFFRKEAIQENGFFRTDLGPIGSKPGAAEDTEYCHRMVNRGKKFMYIGKALVYHQVEPEKLTRSYLTKWRYHCARSVAKSKGMPDETTRYFLVPRYLIRQLFESFIRWNLSINSKQRLYERLKFFWTLGEICETYQLKRSARTLDR